MAFSVEGFNDLEELGINCEANDSLTDAFNKAANHLQTILPSLDNQVLLTLYGYYKQGCQGPCNTPKPSWYDMKAKSKWEAWRKLGEMPQDEAKALYVKTINELDPHFKQTPPPKETWVSVSVLQDDYEINEGDKTIFDHVRENDSEQVLKALQDVGAGTINKVDEDGMGLIHWATDRGFVNVLRILIDFGADVNLQDSDGQTALHYASDCGHADCVKLLLSKNARKDIFDSNGLSPEKVASNDSVKELLN